MMPDPLSRHRYQVRGFLALLVVSFAGIALISCNREHVVVSRLAEIGDPGWTHADSILFDFTVTDTTRMYDMWLEVTHDREYAWENAYVRIRTAFPGDSSKTDLVSLELADASGAWNGVCSGKKCRHTILLQKRFRFVVPGQYGLTFAQYMREEVVHGIYGLRLKVVEVRE